MVSFDLFYRSKLIIEWPKCAESVNCVQKHKSTCITHVLAKRRQGGVFIIIAWRSNLSLAALSTFVRKVVIFWRKFWAENWPKCDLYPLSRAKNRHGSVLGRPGYGIEFCFLGFFNSEIFWNCLTFGLRNGQNFQRTIWNGLSFDNSIESRGSNGGKVKIGFSSGDFKKGRPTRSRVRLLSSLEEKGVNYWSYFAIMVWPKFFIKIRDGG